MPHPKEMCPSFEKVPGSEDGAFSILAAAVPAKE
jgi:hypothetical protein